LAQTNTISNVMTTNLTNTSATISWTSNPVSAVSYSFTTLASPSGNAGTVMLLVNTVGSGQGTITGGSSGRPKMTGTINSFPRLLLFPIKTVGRGPAVF